MMGEIKSTLDLVMKKVGELNISPEEKERFKREEARGLAQRLFNRYFMRDKSKNFGALAEELEGAREGVRTALAELLVSSYSFENPSRENLAGLEMILGKKGGELAGLLKELTTSYQRERNEELFLIEGNLLHDLERRGISGTSVQPNADADPRWGEFIEHVDKSYEERKREVIKMFSYDASVGHNGL